MCKGKQIVKATIISLGEYLGKGKPFYVPCYQRGYVWGRNKPGYDKDSVTFILEKSLIPGFKNGSEIFLQGITVSEKEHDDRIVIIDGQQRTTFFYLLLKWLGYSQCFKLDYSVRDASGAFLKSPSLLDACSQAEDLKEEFQDIFFFKKTLRIIEHQLASYKASKQEILTYVLAKVKFLYVNIPDPNQASKVFSMMNGARAVMLPEEVVKAELLRIVSLPADDYDRMDASVQNALEWDCNLLRSRYAREWDKWLQWWNRHDVQQFFQCNNVMGLLVKLFLNSRQKESKELTFETFKNMFLKAPEQAVDAKNVFSGLRCLQKRFEDSFNEPVAFNRIGAILRILGSNDKHAFLCWYFLGSKQTDAELERYYKLSFLSLTHDEIVDKDAAAFDEKFEERKKELDDDYLYLNNQEAAYRFLLRLNIDEDIAQTRKFNFLVWNKRSLEHIYPKSKVYHKDIETGRWLLGDGTDCSNDIDDIESNASYILRSSCKSVTMSTTECKSVTMSTTEHSIGNMVLLYGNNNSSFGARTFEEKKMMFFSPSEKQVFESRHLLHTIYKFSASKWDGECIAKNKIEAIRGFEDYYGKQV